MEKVSSILRKVYNIEWKGLNILECGAHSDGLETSSFEGNNECWFLEPNDIDYQKLKNKRKNTLNIALSNKNGKVKFTICHGSGNSSCEYSEEQLQELKNRKSTFTETEVEGMTYKNLLEKLNLIFDLFVLDVEGHEMSILNTFKDLEEEKHPKIIVIECGYDWYDRLSLLKEFGYNIDCYYFNNCYLSKGDIKINESSAEAVNKQWKTFTWMGKVIYNNELIK